MVSLEDGLFISFYLKLLKFNKPDRILDCDWSRKVNVLWNADLDLLVKLGGWEAHVFRFMYLDGFSYCLSFH